MYDTPRNRTIASPTIQLIEQDLYHGCYDDTLERYKPRKPNKAKSESQKLLTLLEVWDAFDIGHVGSLAFKTQDRTSFY